MNPNDLTKTLTDGIQNQLPNVDVSQIQSALSSLNMDSLMSGIQGTLSSALGDLSGQISSLAQSSLDQIADTIPEAAKAFFPDVNPTTLTAANVDKKRGPREADSKIQTLKSDSSEATSQPVSFITKPIDDAVKGTDTSTKGTSSKDMLSGMDASSLSNIGKSIGSSISSSSDLMGAITSVTGDLSSQLGVSSFGDALSSGLGAITSIPNAVISGASEFLGSITSSFDDVIEGIGDIVEDVIDVLPLDELANIKLPDELNSLIKNVGDSAIGQSIGDILTDKLGSATNIIDSLQNISSSEDLLNTLLAIGDSTQYSKLTSPSGNPLDSLLGSNTKSTIDEIYNTAAQLCPDIKQPDSIDFRLNKDLYDVLLKLSMDLNLNDLLNQLVQCSDTTNGNIYFDSRSDEILRSNLSTVAYNGEPTTYAAIQKHIDVQQITDPGMDVATLIANSENTETNQNIIHHIAETSKVTIQSLYTENVQDVEVLSTEMISFLSTNGTDIIDHYVTPEVRALAVGAQQMYA